MCSKRGRWGSALCLVLSLVTLCGLLLVPRVSAQVPRGLPAGASCAELAAHDPTATNGHAWGQTLLAGHGAPDGWFGVDVCGNSINAYSPGGANLSCDRVPARMAVTGCAPGSATFDGFGLSFQCVELVVRFAAWAFGDQPSGWLGNAPDLWLRGNHPADFGAIANGGSQAPVPGDVLVWGAEDAQGRPWPSGPASAHAGHVAVVAAVQGDQLTFVEENALSGRSNVPREHIALTHTGATWTVGGTSGAPGARGLYGWLHSWKNTGTYTGDGAVWGEPTPVATPSADPSVVVPTPFGPPSLAPAVVVTPAGMLADLAWSAATSSGAAATAPGAPAVAQSLGSPPGTYLAPDQTPAVLVAADGAREIFVRGMDGLLYEVATDPSKPGVLWHALGAPAGATLIGSPAAVALPSSVAVAAVADDGSLWWRAGPAGNLGDWTAIGHPVSVPLLGAPILAGTPGTGLPLALALGRDGHLYETDWQDSAASDPQWQAGWRGWSQIILPAAAAALTGPLVPIFGLPAQHASIGQWADVALDVIARDSAGALWLLQRGTTVMWRVQPLTATAPATALLGGVPVVAAPEATAGAQLLHIYVAGAQGLMLGHLLLDSTGDLIETQWTPITSLSSGDLAAGSAQVIGLGADLSMLVATQGQQIVLAGAPGALAHVLGATPEPALLPVPTPAGAGNPPGSSRPS